MDLLERIFGVETMQRARESAQAAQAARAAQVAEARRPRPGPVGPRPQPAKARPAPAPVQAPTQAPMQAPAVLPGQAARDEARAALSATDFPTSILGTATLPAPPLLAAFGSREGLLAAIVFAEALGPPLAMR